MSGFEENVAFARDETLDAEILHFQVMKGGHAFHIEHQHRFGAFMAFPLGKRRPRSRWTLPLLVNSAACRLFDLLVHERYLLWLLWNHVGYFSWKYQAMTDASTTTDPAKMPPLPDHIRDSVRARYGEFEYCRYFEYGARDRYVVYWVALRRNGAIAIVEESDGWVGKWGWAMDASFRMS